ncbi:hypothetical protein VST7929_00576 [Vibrio stylophorae]|uniref:M23ase beta-sheet core domain-containing protein n=1 Tax=Vibrio stylophorae TaxID=659351 RepID=A0ABN8DNJ7_9VIBR|nr:M23 family metallopeptidase [Vibrio stylophorae]CAH0532731.1 hypothetical protein VST7929_00576 [Vibrio stylophorae]
MQNHTHISISTKKGTQHFRLGKQFKRSLVLSLLAFTVTLVLSVAGSYFLYGQLTEEKNVINSQEGTISSLQKQLEDEYQNVMHLEEELDRKSQEFKSLTQRMGDVENVLGLEETDADMPLEQRMDVAAINSAVRNTMLQLIPSGSPIKYNRLSSSFGTRVHPVTHKRQRHLGIDLTCKRGTDIIAPADGVIELARKSKQGYGNLIKMRHSFGFMTMFAHMHEFKVKSGQFVKKGTVLGTCGNSGNSTGPHLHYEVRFLARPINPKHFMDWSSTNFDQLFEKEKSVHWASLVELVGGIVAVPVQLTTHDDGSSTLTVANKKPPQDVKG